MKIYVKDKKLLPSSPGGCLIEVTTWAGLTVISAINSM
jgi:hypothetical protein